MVCWVALHHGWPSVSAVPRFLGAHHTCAIPKHRVHGSCCCRFLPRPMADWCKTPSAPFPELVVVRCVMQRGGGGCKVVGKWGAKEVARRHVDWRRGAAIVAVNSNQPSQPAAPLSLFTQLRILTLPFITTLAACGVQPIPVISLPPPFWSLPVPPPHFSRSRAFFAAARGLRVWWAWWAK